MRGVVSTLILALTVILPILVMIYLCAKFKDLTDKTSKQNFNTLLLQIDKESRLRIFHPIFFFLRRFITAIVLVNLADNVVA